MNASEPPAAHWRRFRRLMALMIALGFGAAALAVWYLQASGVPFHIHAVIAMGGGIILAIALAGALMGLVFVSNRSGHDDEVDDR